MALSSQALARGQMAGASAKGAELCDEIGWRGGRFHERGLDRLRRAEDMALPEGDVVFEDFDDADFLFQLFGDQRHTEARADGRDFLAINAAVDAANTAAEQAAAGNGAPF